MTSETWPPPRPKPSNFPPSFFKILQFIVVVVSKGLLSAFVIFFLLQFLLMTSTLIQSMGWRKACVNWIQSQRVTNQSVTMVMYVRWRYQVTTRLFGSGSGCVIILHMILNRVIQRYGITDYVVKSHRKYLMSFEKC
jgi:hypothetical protein